MGQRASPAAGGLARRRRRWRGLRRRLYAWLARGPILLLPRIPFPILRPALRLTVTPVCRLLLRRKAARHLDAALGQSLSALERRRILNEMFRGMGDMLAEVSAHAGHGAEFFARHVDDRQARAWMRAFERSWHGGWIGLTGHVGNWELMAQWMHHFTVRGHGGTIAKRQPNPHLNRLIERIRGRHGMVTLYRDDSPARVLRLLRSGSGIGTAPDQDVSSIGGVFLDFLGRPAYTPLGPARLAWAANVPILVGFCYRDGGRLRLQANEPIFPDRSRPKHAEILRMTEEWNRQVETFVLAHPDQWQWIHDRWKTTPEKLAARGRRRLAAEPG